MKLPRHAAILDLVRSHRIPSQEALRERLAERGIEVAQATLSRDIRDLGLVKAPDEHGGSAYVIPAGGAQPIAAAIDSEGWPEIVGTLGGDDTILIVLRSPDHRETIVTRIESIADRRTE